MAKHVSNLHANVQYLRVLRQLISHIVTLKIESRGRDVDIDLGQYLTSGGCSFPAPLPPHTMLGVNVSSILIFVSSLLCALVPSTLYLGGVGGSEMSEVSFDPGCRACL